MRKAKKNWVLCLGGSKSKIPIVESIKKNNLNCCVVDKDKNCPCAKISDLFINLSASNHKKILQRLSMLKIQNKILCIFAYTSFTRVQSSAINIADCLNLPFPSKKNWKLTSNKLLFKKTCKINKIPTIDHIYTKNLDDLKNFFKEKRRVICKPIDGVGSENVFLFESPKDIPVNLNFSKVFFEEYLGDELYIFQGLIIDHQIIFSHILRKNIRKGSFTIGGYSIIENPEKNRLMEAQSLKFLKKICLNNSFFTIDLIFNKKSFYFLEIGFLMDSGMDILLKYLGIDIFDIFLKSVTRNLQKQSFHLPKNLNMIFLYPKKNGTINKLYNLKDLNVQNSKLFYLKKEGDKCSNKRIVSNTLGYLISKNDELKNLKKISSRLETRTKII